MNWDAGVELKKLIKPMITREQLKSYAEASGDKNPIHLDDDFAKAAGFGSVIVHGMISMAFMADHLLYNFPYTQFRLARIRSRFRKVIFPGDQLTCEGKVKKILPDGGYAVSLSVRNQNGEISTDGEAEIYPRARPTSE